MGRVILSVLGCVCLWSGGAVSGEAFDRAADAIRRVEESGGVPDVAQLLGIIKAQQEAIAELGRMPGDIESRVERLEAAVADANDPYAFESAANRVDAVRRDLDDLSTRMGWIESTLRTHRMYGAP